MFWEAAGLEVLMESLRNYHQLASDGLNLADAAQTPAIREQAEKRQQRQLYESFMRVMALEGGSSSRPRFDRSFSGRASATTFR